MRQNIATRFSLVAVLAGALLASPAAAQGKGKPDKAKGKDKDRPELVRRDRQETRWDERLGDYDRRYEDRYEEKGNGPPFCRPGGNGHPVHGPRWCEEKGYGYPGSYGRYDDRGRYDSRYPDGDRRYEDRDGRYGSYEAEHEDFHRYLDRKYSQLAAQRPLDLRYQVQLRAEKKAEHDAWHARMGRRHD